jgi:Zn-dependent protease with chaperone function
MQTTEAYRALVEKLEALARERPEHYRRRVAALAVLGIGYRVLVTLAAFFLPAAIVLAVFPGTWTAAAVAAAGILAIAWVFWVATRPIPGRRLTEAEAPALFAALEALRAKLLCPPVHEVVLDHEFNAAAAWTPRRGAFGVPRQQLLLGVPLLAVLSKEQLLAVVGHELGHFSRAHGRAGHWIYRIRASWEDLYDNIGRDDSPLGSAVNLFYGWFVPYFGAYSFALARLNEYEADASSALVAGAGNAASALATVDAYSGWLERRFWPALWRSAREHAEPPLDVCRRLAEAARAVPPGELQARQRDALRRASGLEDTHPSLAERLAALELPGEQAIAPPAVCAGEALLGQGWEAALREAGQAWSFAHARAWRDGHRELKKIAERLEQLKQLPGERDFALRLEIARLSQVLEGPQAVQELWQALRAEAPGHALVALHGAQALAEADSQAALAALDALAAREPRHAIAALGALKEIALQSGDKLRADQADTRLRQAWTRRNAAFPLLSKAVWRGSLEAPGLPGYAVELLRQKLKADEAIKGAFLAAVVDPEAAPYRGTLLVIRLDPHAMERAGRNEDTIVAAARDLLSWLVEPYEFYWALNYFMTEAVEGHIEAGLAALPGSCLFGDLSRPEGYGIDPRNLR